MIRRRSSLGLLLFLGAYVVEGGCGGTPWFLGQPLTGQSSIPPTSRAETVADHRYKLELARANGDKLLELAELSVLEQRGALDAKNSLRLSELLRERGRDWVALRRPIPLAEDLRHIAMLEPARARALNGAIRSAARAAGDVWLSLGENARAEEEYRHAERLGAPGMLYRMRAVWGASPADLERDVLEHALTELPERVLGSFATAYLDAGGAEPRLLQRAWRAARVYGPPELVTRIQTFLVAPPPGQAPGQQPGQPGPDAGVPAVAEGAGLEKTTLPSSPPSPSPLTPAVGSVARDVSQVTLVEPGPNDHLYRGPTLARVLLPLAAAFPSLTGPGPRSRAWADQLMAEDPTAPDSLELAALIDARAGRTGGAARKLVDLVFFSPDRAEGHARAARVWEKANEGRRACLDWERAAHLGAVDDSRWCNLIGCLRANPGAGDAVAVSRFARARAPALTCDAAENATPPRFAADGGRNTDSAPPPSEDARARSD